MLNETEQSGPEVTAMPVLSSSIKSLHQLPEVLKSIKFRAVIDWIEIELTLQKPSQWQPLKRRAGGVWGNLYVKSMESKESSRVFRFHVQDPKNCDDFLRQVQSLARDGESIKEDDIRIVGIEIAIDAYYPGSDPDILALVALHFLKHHANLPGGFPRISEPPYFDNLLLKAKSKAELEAHRIACAEAWASGSEPPKNMPEKDGSANVASSDRDALDALRRGLTINQGAAPKKRTSDPAVTLTGTRKTTVRIPNRILAAFKAKAELTGTRYQTLIVRSLNTASKDWGTTGAVTT